MNSSPAILRIRVGASCYDAVKNSAVRSVAPPEFRCVVNLTAPAKRSNHRNFRLFWRASLARFFGDEFPKARYARCAVRRGVCRAGEAFARANREAARALATRGRFRPPLE